VTVRAIQADLADPGEVQRISDEMRAMSVDMMVNNAGLAHYKPFADPPQRRPPNWWTSTCWLLCC
jgi:short-subunit dehydrogenase